MAIVTILTCCVLLIGLVVTVHMSQATDSTSNDYWYDLWNYYNKYHESYNNYLDKYIMASCKKIKNTLINDNGSEVPDIGTYYFEYDDGTVGVIKTIRKINNKEIYEYKIFSTTESRLKRFKNDLNIFTKKTMEVNVMSIDTSSDNPAIVPLTKLCKDARPNQDKVIEHIVNHWNAQNDFNTKVMLYGDRGVGKTYVAKLLKKYIETIKPSTNVQLFDDFNPSTIAVNVNTMVLQKATDITPVILVINEIDTVYDKVISGQEPFDHRLQHSRNKQEFHNMLDAIGNKKHVIAIYTMEQDPLKLYKDVAYTSFMRNGRVDFFIKITEDDATLFDHPKN
jgi:hypothetical protein